MLGYQGFVAFGGNFDMDVGQAADVVARPVAFERVPSFPVGDHRGPVRIIVIPLFVDQPEFDDGSW